MVFCDLVNPVPLTVAVLDDEAKFRQAQSRLLKTHGFKVESFETGDQLLAALERQRFDSVLLDLHMPGMTGFDVLERLARHGPRTPVIVVTGHDGPENETRVRSLGAADYLVKPVDDADLLEALQQAMSPPRLTVRDRTDNIDINTMENA